MSPRFSPRRRCYHIDKTQFDVPFRCGARDLGEALRRVAEGATMLRTKGEPGTGDVVQAVRHMRKIQKQIRDVVALRDDELFEAAKQLQVPVELVREVHATGKLPVVNFAAGGVATPADAALMMQLGAEGVFVGSGIFKSGDPAKRAAAIVKAVATSPMPSSSPSFRRTWARLWWASTPTRSRLSWRSAGASPAEGIAHERLCRPNGRRVGGPRRFCRARGEAVEAGRTLY